MKYLFSLGTKLEKRKDRERRKNKQNTTD